MGVTKQECVERLERAAIALEVLSDIWKEILHLGYNYNPTVARDAVASLKSQARELGLDQVPAGKDFTDDYWFALSASGIAQLALGSAVSADQ